MAGQLARELEVAQAAAREAGELLRGFRKQCLEVHEKADRSLVTSADLAAEELVLGRLRAEFPEDAILSEESGESGMASGRRWIVDPLDGTTNFSRGLPFYAVSVALWVDGLPAVAALSLPALGEEFAAVAGAGATLNGTPIRVSETERVEQAMVNVYYDRHSLLEPGLTLTSYLARACEGRVKNMGSTASMLCYVACGRLDAFVRNSTKLWDFAAGGLVLREADGTLSDFEENALTRSGQSLLASNGRLHGALAEISRRAMSADVGVEKNC
jgi:myo-inositol-1(or 4)-monophosphatase